MSKIKTAKSRLASKLGNASLVVATVIMASAAHAEAGLDVAAGVTELGYAAAAVGLLGAAKIAPSALMWTWGMVTRMASRG